MHSWALRLANINIRKTQEFDFLMLMLMSRLSSPMHKFLILMLTQVGPGFIENQLLKDHGSGYEKSCEKYEKPRAQ